MAEAPTGGKLARNIMHFARALRAAGIPVGPGRVLDALKAVEVVGVARRSDLYWTLFAVFVDRQDQRELFDQCFHVFWRDPQILERMMSLLLPQLEQEGPAPPEQEVSRRVGEALGPEKKPGKGETEEDSEEPALELDAVLTWSAKELLQAKDFEQMSADELLAAKREIERLRLPIMDVPTRRFVPDAHGRRIDMRRTLRQSLRGGGGAIDLMRKTRLRRHPPLVILCDISGSMSRYSRMLMLFMHAVTNDRDRVFSFLFGTRLTNITRYLRHRDVDIALDKVGEVVLDWSGGTRIGHCLEEFNRVWSQAGPGPGCRGADDQRRARPRRRRRPRRRDGASAQELPPADLAQPLVALRRLQPHLLGGPGDDPPRRRLPHGAQSGEPRGADPGALCGRRAPRGRALRVGRRLTGKERGMSASTFRDDQLLDQAQAWRGEGRKVAIATVVNTWGSSPRPAGSQLVVDDQGNMLGSVSGGCIEGAVVKEALEIMEGAPPKVLDFGVSNEQAWEVGLACGGKVQVYVEALQ